MPDEADGQKGEPSTFEREKWEAERDNRKEELVIKRRELDIRELETRRGRWTNPLVLAIAGTFFAALANIGATYWTATQQRNTDSIRYTVENQREREKAESQLILEVIKTANPDKAAENLKFLVDVELINDRERRSAITKYVRDRSTGTGASLPAPTSSSPDFEPYQSILNCEIRSAGNLGAIATAVSAAASEVGSTKIDWKFDAGRAHGRSSILPRERATAARITYELVTEGESVSFKTLIVPLDYPMMRLLFAKGVFENVLAKLRDTAISLQARYVERIGALPNAKITCEPVE